MPINATNNSQPRELIPAGNHLARCFSMIEIGTVPEIVMGKSVIMKKVRIGWELPEETRVFGERGELPLVIAKEYTLSMNEKSNLRKDLKAWRGKDFTEEQARSFDITTLLGVPCMLNVIHKPSKSDPTKIYEQIAGLTPIPKSLKCPPQVNPTFVLSYDQFDRVLFDKLPDFIKTKMQTSLEFPSVSGNGHDNHYQEEMIVPIGEEIEDLPF